MRIVELEMMLGVVIGLVIVIMHIAVDVGILPCAVVAAVCLIGLQIDSVPGDSRMLVAHQIGEFQRIVPFHPSYGSICGLDPRLCVPDISVRISSRIGQIKVKPGFRKSCTCRYCCRKGVVRAIGDIKVGIWLRPD